MAAVVMVVKMSIIKALLKTAASTEQKVKPKGKKGKLRIGGEKCAKVDSGQLCASQSVSFAHKKKFARVLVCETFPFSLFLI